jgi:hypothetical protein
MQPLQTRPLYSKFPPPSFSLLVAKAINPFNHRERRCVRERKRERERERERELRERKGERLPTTVYYTDRPGREGERKVVERSEGLFGADATLKCFKMPV